MGATVPLCREVFTYRYEWVIFHRFRHTFATMVLERGVNPRVVQGFLGHRDISTTLGIYTGVTSEVMKAAAEGADEALRGRW